MTTKIVATEAIAKLAELFPRTFFVRPADRRPLKIGIHNDLKAAKVLSVSKRNGALHFYTTSAGYLHNMIEGAARIDLNGDPVDTVSAHDAAYAVELLQQRNGQPKAIGNVSAFIEKPTAEAVSNVPEVPNETPPKPKRIGLGDLKAAAQRRQLQAAE